MMKKPLRKLEDFLYNFYGEENKEIVCAVWFLNKGSHRISGVDTSSWNTRSHPEHDG